MEVISRGSTRSNIACSTSRPRSNATELPVPYAEFLVHTAVEGGRQARGFAHGPVGRQPVRKLLGVRGNLRLRRSRSRHVKCRSQLKRGKDLLRTAATLLRRRCRRHQKREHVWVGQILGERLSYWELNGTAVQREININHLPGKAVIWPPGMHRWPASCNVSVQTSRMNYGDCPPGRWSRFALIHCKGVHPNGVRGARLGRFHRNW